jgi:hypothetical protein
MHRTKDEHCQAKILVWLRISIYRGMPAADAELRGKPSVARLCGDPLGRGIAPVAAGGLFCYVKDSPLAGARFAAVRRSGPTHIPPGTDGS